ncbi:MAG TPA: glutamate--tRNA ligase family protein [Candidatus Paceibacterota bacterium]|nr:glutamate--tRNA ligase family protein [Candidatus Paceibacterota bacterium]HPI24421.1 glutamate--tRNA ligase family protein [Candidatus Paceibacterota bacterium]
MKNKVITRVAPSPTGLMHIGTARVALFNYLFTKQNDGKIILRIEDTDRERSKPEFEKNIKDGFSWLGLTFDEIWKQSERTEIYTQYLQKLLAEDLAYVSQEEAKKEGDRSSVIRFRNPGQKITFQDLIHGEITFDTTELGDFVIAKDLETPIFHFANVVDDLEAGTTHIIRGDDHISNTPRQILIFKALGGPIPTYAHLPMILAPDKTKLSKRHGAWPVTEYRDEGYLKEAVLNFIVLLGWSPQSRAEIAQDGTEDIVSLDQMLKLFDLAKVQKKGAVFNLEKLNWLNREHLKRLSSTERWQKITDWLPPTKADFMKTNELMLQKITPLILERVSTLKEAQALLANGEFDYFFHQPKPSQELLRTTTHLTEIASRLSELAAEDFTAETIKNKIWDFATEKGRGEVLWPLRVALSGKEKSPDPFVLAAILGRAETLNRIKNALS